MGMLWALGVVQISEVTRNDKTLDLRGTLVELEDLGVTVQLLDRTL